MENVAFKSVEKEDKISKVVSKIPRFLKSPKSLIYLLMLVSLPTSILLVKTVQDIRQRASEIPVTPPEPPSAKAKALKIEPKNYVTIPNNSVFRAPLTIEAWVKPQIDPNNDASAVVYAYEPHSTCSSTFGINVERDSRYNPTKFKTKTSIQTQDRSVGFGGTNLYDYDKWAHIAVTYDIDGNLKTYVNGSLDNTQKLDGTLCPNPMNINIGTFTGGTNGWYYNGLIDEVRISSIIRPDTSFGSLLPLESDLNTIALYQFENNTKDSSNNAFNGTIVGIASYADSIVQPTPTPIITIIPPTGDPAPLPDLTIPEGTIIITPSTQVVNSTTNIKFKLTNVGNSPTLATYSYSSQSDGYSTLSPDNTCTNSTVLNPGDTCVSSYDFTFQTPGAKYFTISIDPNNQITESNENNNTFETKTYIIEATPTPVVSNSPTPTPYPTQYCPAKGSEYRTFCSGNYIYESYANGQCGTAVNFVSNCSNGCKQITTTNAQCVGTSGTPTPAPTIIPTPTPKLCPAKIASASYSNTCRYGFFQKGYRKVSYRCSDNFKANISVKDCTPSITLYEQAAAACAKRQSVCR